MSVSNAPRATHDEADEIVPEDWPTYYTQVPVWVLLSGCTAQAYRLYALLAEHINLRQPGRRVAFPKQKTIARFLGLANPRQVKRYADELADLGAIRVEAYRYGGGMRRSNRYHVRFNPPSGYTGLLSLSEFYAAEKAQAAGQPGGTENSTTGCAENGPAHGAPDGTAQRDQQERHQEERDAAPSARSAPDGRRPPTGSTARDNSGYAASEKREPARTKQQREAVRNVLHQLPAELTALLPARTPPTLTRAILDALALDDPAADRTPEQLARHRVTPKWDKHYAALAERGRLERPVGALIAMLARQAECGSPRCDERIDVDTGQPCTLCAARQEDKRAARKPAPPEPKPGPADRDQRSPTPPRIPTQRAQERKPVTANAEFTAARQAARANRANTHRRLNHTRRTA